MYDPFITAINTQKTTVEWIGAVSQNLGNVYTPGYREVRSTFADFVNGVRMSEIPRSDDQGKAVPGRAPTNLYCEGKGFFAVRKGSGQLMFTRLGDFKFDANGTYVNEQGYKVQGYMLGEDGKILNTGGVENGGNPNSPSHSAGGPGHIPTTEINLWVDPSNGKFFGKYDEYKIKSDGTLVGIGDQGKTVTPLYKVALVNFVNPGGLAMPEDQMFIPTKVSGEPVEGTGEVRSGLLESSNTNLKEQVNFLQQAKLQMNVVNKLITTNKNLLEEAMRLIQ